MKHKWPKLFLLVALILFLKIAFYGSFIDEHENMVAGWLMSNGFVPYRDFFFHHAPLPFFVSFLLFPLAQKWWWVFRVVTLLFWSGGAMVVWKNADYRLRLPASISLVLIALAAPVLNLQMFLADTIFAVSIWVVSLLLASLFLTGFPREKVVLKWLLFFGFISVWSSVTAFFSFFILGFILLIMILKNYNFKWQVVWQKYWRMGLWFIGLNLIFPIYFLLSNAWDDFVWSVFNYNQQYYFPLRLAQNAKELQWGIVYKTLNQFLNLIIFETSFIFSQIRIFILTFKSIFLNIFSTQFLESLKQLQIMFLMPLNLLTVRPDTILVFTMMLVVLFLIVRRKIWRLFIFCLVALSLYVRSNEIFHYSALFVGVVGIGTIMGFFKKVNRGVIGRIFLSFVILLWLWKFIPPYLEFNNNHFPIVSVQKQLVSKEIKLISQPEDNLQLIGGSTVYYMLSNRLPASKQIYYFEWLQPAEKLTKPLYSSVGQADMILLEEGFDQELVDLVETNYTEINQELGIYVKKTN